MRVLAIFAGAVILGSIAILGSASVSLNHLRVGGPIYSDVVSKKDLVADILPPPLYVLEAYLLAVHIAEDPTSAAGAKPKLAALRDDFVKRSAYWGGSQIDAGLKARLKTSSELGEAFWTILLGRLAPAADAGDATAVRAAAADLQKAYAAHRAAIDVLVVDANAALERVEAEAQTANVFWQATMLGTGGFVLVLLIGGALFIRGRIVRPLDHLTTYMSTLAAGDYAPEPPRYDRSDEIGAMARAVAVFRQAGLDRVEAERRVQEARTRQEAERRERESRDSADNEERARVVGSLAIGLKRVAQGDLAYRIQDWLGAYEQLRDDFNQAVAKLAETMERIAQVASSVHGGSHDIARAADELARRTEHQAASLEETSAALAGVVQGVR
ncbi:MAG TPA: methyl-accepting chemotaxis protein, partial [Beijerinckiaceae bacterium]